MNYVLTREGVLDFYCTSSGLVQRVHVEYTLYDTCICIYLSIYSRVCSEETYGTLWVTENGRQIGSVSRLTSDNKAYYSRATSSFQSFSLRSIDHSLIEDVARGEHRNFILIPGYFSQHARSIATNAIRGRIYDARIRSITQPYQEISHH